MSTRRKLIIFTLGLVLIIVLFYLVIFSTGGDSDSDSSSSDGSLENILEDLSGQPVASSSDLDTNSQVVEDQELPQVEFKEDLKELSATKLSLSQLKLQVVRFIERWGTYSNQSNFQAIKSLEDEMTINMRRNVNTYITDIRQKHPFADGYYGISTTAVIVDIPPLSGSEEIIRAKVSTRRTESAKTFEETYSQEASVILSKQGNEWLISSVTWE